MTLTQATILGLVQGLTEFLPISSSGHLVFIPKLFGWGDQGLIFDVMVHWGTLIAVIVYFRKKIWGLLLYFRKSSNEQTRQENKRKRTLFCFILMTIIPSGIVGFFFGGWIEANTRAVWIVATSLIFWGVVLGVADRFSARFQVKNGLEEINWKSALFIALAQALAFIPGTSRSGITMTAALFAKLDKISAAEFSFLMSIPIIALTGGAKILELLQRGGGSRNSGAYVAGFLASMVSGWFAIWFLLKLIKRWSFLPFAAYRIIIGGLILLFLMNW